MVLNQPTYDLFAPHKSGEATAQDVIDAIHSVHMLPLPLLDTQDLSNAVLYLASDESRTVTGILLPVDAGSTQKLG